MCSPPSPTRSRTRGHRTATAPMPVTISRSGRCPWRTSRRRPSSVNLSVWVLSQAATSASTACPNSVLAPLRKTSVSGSENVPGWVSSKPLVSVTAYPSFGGEVEALNTPTIRRLTPSCRHQLSALAPPPGNLFGVDLLSERIEAAKQRYPGAVVWYDFRYNNPYNHNVQGVTKELIRRLFPSFR